MMSQAQYREYKFNMLRAVMRVPASTRSDHKAGDLPVGGTVSP